MLRLYSLIAQLKTGRRAHPILINRTLTVSNGWYHMLLVFFAHFMNTDVVTAITGRP